MSSVLKEIEKHPEIKRALEGWQSVAKELKRLDAEVGEFESREKEALNSAEQYDEEVETLEESWRQAVAEDDEKEADKITNQIAFKRERARQARERAKILKAEAESRIDAIALKWKPARAAATKYWRDVLLAAKAEAKERASEYVALARAAEHLWHSRVSSSMGDMAAEIFRTAETLDQSELINHCPPSDPHGIFHGLEHKWRIERRVDDVRLGRLKETG